MLASTREDVLCSHGYSPVVQRARLYVRVSTVSRSCHAEALALNQEPAANEDSLPTRIEARQSGSQSRRGGQESALRIALWSTEAKLP